MLCFNPTKRIGVDESLAHPYFDGLHAPDDEPVADSLMDWGFDDFKLTKRLIQNKVYAECAAYNPQIAERDKTGIKEMGIDLSEARPVPEKSAR